MEFCVSGVLRLKESAVFTNFHVDSIRCAGIVEWICLEVIFFIVLWKTVPRFFLLKRLGGYKTIKDFLNSVFLYKNIQIFFHNVSKLYCDYVFVMFKEIC